MRKPNDRQRQKCLDTLPASMLEEYVRAQTGVPRGTLADKMIAAWRDS